MSGKLVSIVAAGNVSAGKVGCEYLIGRPRALHLHPCIVLFTFQMRPRISKRGAEELSVGPSFRKNYHVDMSCVMQSNIINYEDASMT